MAITDRKINTRAVIAKKRFRPGRIPDGVLTPVTISRGTTAAKFQVSAFLYAIGGQIYYKAATDELVFSAVHATGIGGWFAALLLIDRDGTITTKSNPNTGDQDFATEALALASIIPGAAALDPAGTVRIGTITLKTGVADWDANTDALDAADLVSINYNGEYGDRRWAQFQPGHKFRITGVRAPARALAGVAQVEVLTTKNGFTGLLTHPRLEVDRRTVAAATITKIRVGSFLYAINGVVYWKAAEKQIAFTAVHTVTADQWGAIQIRINAAGTVSSYINEATQTTALNYDNSAAARAHAPAVASGYCQVGLIVIEAKNATWTANTDDMLAASDLENLDVLPDVRDRLLSNPGLALDSAEKEDFKCAAFTYVIDGVKYSKIATIGLDFTVAHVCALDKFLAILVQINAAGTISTKVPLVDGRSQTASQGFDTEGLAIAALPSTDPGKVALGYILIAADASTFTANTDDMEAASDVDGATFVSYEAADNEVYAVQGQAPAVNSHALLTLGAKDPCIGDENGQLIALLAGTTGVVTDPQLDIEYRAYPLSSEV